MNAFSAGMAEFWQVIQRPDGTKRDLSFQRRQLQVSYLWSWYDGTVFSPYLPFTVQLVNDLKLYKETRMQWNIVPDIVDFWASIIYPGNLTDDADSAIPLDAKTDAKLRLAINQVWDWGQWNVYKNVAERYCATLGNLFIRVKDDVEKGRVYPEIIWPGFVKEVECDIVGNVKRYVLEYMIYLPDDPDKERLYREEVDGDQYQHFLDDKPYNISQEFGSSWKNPYGFVPAIYRYHRRTLGVYGIPAVGAALPELAAINSLESHMEDQVHKQIDPVTVFWTGGSGLASMLKRAKAQQAVQGAASSAPMIDVTPALGRDSWRFLEGPLNGKMDQVTGSGDLANSMLFLEHKKAEFKAKFPEYDVYNKLRAMPDISGKAAETLLGDTKPKVVERRAEADPQTIKLAQMCIAVAGFRLQERQGGWSGALTAAQQLFRGYGLDSYDNGDLDFKIDDRPFIPQVPLGDQELADLMISMHEGLGVSVDWLLENEAKKTKAEIAKMNIQDPKQMLANMLGPGNVDSNGKPILPNNQPGHNNPGNPGGGNGNDKQPAG